MLLSFMIDLRYGASRELRLLGGAMVRSVPLQAMISWMIFSGISSWMSCKTFVCNRLFFPTRGNCVSTASTMVCSFGSFVIVFDIEFSVCSVCLILRRLGNVELAGLLSDLSSAEALPCLGAKVFCLLAERSLTAFAWLIVHHMSKAVSAGSVRVPTGFSIGKLAFIRVLATSLANFRE